MLHAIDAYLNGSHQTHVGQASIVRHRIGHCFLSTVGSLLAFALGVFVLVFAARSFLLLCLAAL